MGVGEPLPHSDRIAQRLWDSGVVTHDSRDEDLYAVFVFHDHREPYAFAGYRERPYFYAFEPWGVYTGYRAGGYVGYSEGFVRFAF